MEKSKSDIIQKAQYDVFISHSNKDYLDEKTGQPIDGCTVAKIYEFLDKQGIRCWIDRKGIGVTSSFAGKIGKAIRESKMLVFVSSEHSNDSKWVYREISYADQIDKKILTIRIDNTEYNEDIGMYLQGGQSSDYFRAPSESLDILLNAINDEKDKYEKKLQVQIERRAREGEEQKKEQIRGQINSDKNKYYLHSFNLKEESDLIINKLLSIGEKHKICPICGANVPLQNQYCGTCGWTFVPSFEISEDKIDKEQLALVKGLWDEVLSSRNATVQNPEQVNRMKKEIEGYIAKISELVRRLGHSSLTSSTVNPRHGYVDLGLPSGTMWATCNVGASNPSDYGDYFAWGETESKDKSGGYYWQNLKYRTDEDSYENVRFSKYVAEAKYGTIDNMTILEPSDDAAHVQWGGIWRMPTHEEWMELHENCDWKWTRQDGCKGYRVTSRKNGSSIFLPAAGWRAGESRGREGVNGYYWSSSLSPDKSYCAFDCFFYSGDVNPSRRRRRYRGLSVRPVASSLQ